MKHDGLRRDLNCIEGRRPSYPLSLGERDIEDILLLGLLR
jgi:hypothetical protein